MTEEELIGRYRATSELRARPWCDALVRDDVCALSRAITLALVAGWGAVARDIVAVLMRCEPLHERARESYEGTLLWCVYQHHTLRDRAASLAALTVALERFPDDALFQRMHRLLSH
jgi:hypothetical protein